MMKKTLCILLAACLSLALILPATAAELSAESEQKPVSVNVTGTQNIGTVYAIDFKWDSLEFTYSFGDAELEWNPATHKYDINTTGQSGWQKADDQDVLAEGGLKAEITITNHSNVNVDFDAKLSRSTAVEGVAVNFTDENGTLVSGVGRTHGEADSKTFELTVSGAPTALSNTTTVVDIGTLSVTLSDPNT